MKVRYTAVTLVATLLCACTSAEPAPQPSTPFTPDPAPANGTRFLTVGDFGTGGDVQVRIAEAMCRLHDSEPFDVVVSTGDNVYPSGDPAGFEDHFKEPFACLFERGVRFHSVLGNHDVVTAGGIHEIEDPSFGMPDRYYGWRLGPIRFTMLDSNVLDDIQLRWMRDRLKRVQNAPWSVVVFHHPVFTSGDNHHPDPTLARLLNRPFARYGVDLVLNGHDHLYARGRTDGVTHIVTGGGGYALYGCVSDLPPEVERCLPVHHFVQVDATADELTATAVTVDEAVIERTTVPSNP